VPHLCATCAKPLVLPVIFFCTLQKEKQLSTDLKEPVRTANTFMCSACRC
jgi:hypothetical protein